MEESPAFVEFLEFLGHKIELHDFKGFGRFSVKLSWLGGRFQVSVPHATSCVSFTYLLIRAGFKAIPEKKSDLESPDICSAADIVIE